MNLTYSNVDIWLRIPFLFCDSDDSGDTVNGKNNLLEVAATGKSTGKIKKSGIGGLGRKGGKGEIIEKEVEGNCDPDSWRVWDFFRHVSNSDKRVHIALEFKSEAELERVSAGV